MGSNYDDVYDRPPKDPEGFWSEAAQPGLAITLIARRFRTVDLPA